MAVDIDDYYHAKELEAKHRLNLQILEMASALALSESAELHVAHVWEAIGEASLRGSARRPVTEVDAYVDDVRQQRALHLARLIDETVARFGSDLKAQSHLPKGSPRWEIPALASKIEADLVVMGTVARTGISGFVMGNTAETILNQIDCSVLAIKPPGFVTPVILAH